MNLFVGIVFGLTYLGMAFGRIPGLAVDRTGIALLAAVALVAGGALDGEAALATVDLPTILLLFGLMILSAQYQVAGFYDWCAQRVAVASLGPPALLAATVAVTGVLSAVLVNDVVCFAIAPLLCTGLQRRGLDPRPFLLGLAGAANAGSAATLIGNPQNILLGSTADLDFLAFTAVCGVPALVALVFVFLAIRWVWRRELRAEAPAPSETPPSPDRRALAKAVAATVVLIALFCSPIPRELSAVCVAAALLVTRRHWTRTTLSHVDWPLLLLFVGLFIVNGALTATGLPDRLLADGGFRPDRLSILVPLLISASNTIGNVPAVIMLTAQWPGLSDGSYMAIAVVSTLAGNLLLVGSIANLIVAARAAAAGVKLSFRDHARSGIPMTLGSIAFAAVWLRATGQIGW